MYDDLYVNIECIYYAVSTMNISLMLYLPKYILFIS